MLLAGLALCIGAGVSYLVVRLKIGSYQKLADDIIGRADREVAEKKQRLKEELSQEKQRLKEKEDQIERRMQLVERKLIDTEKREVILKGRREQLKKSQKACDEKLLSIANMNITDAQERFMHQVRGELTSWLKREQQAVEKQAEKHAQQAISTAIGRISSSVISESALCTVSLPNDEIKGRIIGREGRNIHTLETLTGVNLMIDEMPGAVVISGFDPVRRHIAKLALTDLILDGRIHPTKIEEAVEKARETTEKEILQFGEEAALKAGCLDLHQEILRLLGKLKFRYSYGQNLLEHSLEVSSLLGIMCAELGLDERLGRRIGLLHDMGKAVSHERQGTHAMIGQELSLKYGESTDVANGIGCHHGEVDPQTIEGGLCSAADALSAARPGARMEAVESYIKRLGQLESLACEFEGVREAHVLQAGREVRIIVEPTIIDDTALTHLVRDLAKAIEQRLSYPGKIKVTATRQSRVTHYAL